MTTNDPGFVFTDIVAGCGCSFPFAYCIMFDFSSRTLEWMCLTHARSESKIEEEIGERKNFWRYTLPQEEHLHMITMHDARPPH